MVLWLATHACMIACKTGALSKIVVVERRSPLSLGESGGSVNMQGMPSTFNVT